MASATPAERRAFLSITECDPSGRESHAAAADLDGTLLVSRSFFSYFFFLAVKAGSLLRGLALLVPSPLVLAVYKLVSEAAGIKILIYVAVAGLRTGCGAGGADVAAARFYAADVLADSWAAFRACGRRREVVTANPTVMVEAFAREYLGADEVLGMELEVDGRTGRAMGRVASPGVLVGRRKREAVEREFGSALSELGLGDRESDRDFMALCKVRSSSSPSPDTHPTALSLSGTVAQGCDISGDSCSPRRPTIARSFRCNTVKQVSSLFHGFTDTNKASPAVTILRAVANEGGEAEEPARRPHAAACPSAAATCAAA